MSDIEKHGYGWHPDIPDHRDLMYKAGAPVAIQDRVDLRNICPPVYNQGALGSCHKADTEFLTKEGWKLFKDISVNDELASVDVETGKLIYEKPLRLIDIDYNGDMYYCDKNNLSFAITADHKLVVRKWDESKRTLSKQYSNVEVQNLGWYCGLPSVAQQQGNDCEYITIKGVSHKRKLYRQDIQIDSDLWMQFLGIYIAEGTLIKNHMPIYAGEITRKYNRNNYKIQLAAVKPREREFILSILKKLYINPCILKDRFTFQDKRIFMALHAMGLYGIKAPHKFVPDFIFTLSPRLIKSFLHGHQMGDGCDSDGTISHYTSSNRLANDLQRLMFLSGHVSTLSSRPPRTSVMKDGRVVCGKYPEYRICKYQNVNISINKKEDIVIKPYKGKVYCAEMPTYHTLVTRYQGKILISHNCTANAIGGVTHFIELKQNVPDAGVPSRLFIYYNERAMEGTINQDAGAQIRDGIKVVANWGCPLETLWPYDIKKFAVKPPTITYLAARKHKAIQYTRLQSLNDMQSCLSEGFPFTFGFTVYESFESQTVAKTGKMPMPSRRERVLGGHAVMAVGYDNAKQVMIVRNSWGTNWGDPQFPGYFYMPYAFITNKNLASDFWTIRAMS